MTGPYTPDPNDPTRPLNNDEVQYGAEELRKLKGKVGTLFSCKSVVLTAYTLLSTDIGNLVDMTVGGIITVPASLGTGLIGLTGTGEVTIVGAAGVTILVESTLQPKLFGTNAFAVLTRKSNNVWLLAGNLAFSAG